MLYIIGAYFGKYKLRENYHFRNFSKNKYQLLLLALFIVSIFLAITPKIITDYFENSTIEILSYVKYLFGLKLIDYISPVIILESVLYLLLFETFDFKSKFINKFASLTFGIYLAHENNFLVKFLYDRLPISVNGVIYPNVIIKMLLYSIIIFIVSAIIEYIRQLLSKLITKTKIYKKFINKIENYIKAF